MVSVVSPTGGGAWPRLARCDPTSPASRTMTGVGLRREPEPPSARSASSRRISLAKVFGFFGEPVTAGAAPLDPEFRWGIGGGIDERATGGGVEARPSAAALGRSPTRGAGTVDATGSTIEVRAGGGALRPGGGGAPLDRFGSGGGPDALPSLALPSLGVACGGGGVCDGVVATPRLASSATLPATSAATFAISSDRSSRPASAADSAARRSHFKASAASPRDHKDSAVESAQPTSSSSSARGSGIGALIRLWRHGRRNRRWTATSLHTKRARERAPDAPSAEHISVRALRLRADRRRARRASDRRPAPRSSPGGRNSRRTHRACDSSRPCQ